VLHDLCLEQAFGTLALRKSDEVAPWTFVLTDVLVRAETRSEGVEARDMGGTEIAGQNAWA
jgi:hypothetical protein